MQTDNANSQQTIHGTVIRSNCWWYGHRDIRRFDVHSKTCTVTVVPFLFEVYRTIKGCVKTRPFIVYLYEREVYSPQGTRAN